MPSGASCQCDFHANKDEREFFKVRSVGLSHWAPVLGRRDHLKLIYVEYSTVVSVEIGSSDS